MKNQNNNNIIFNNNNKNNINELNLIFSENIQKIDKVNKNSFNLKKNFINTIKTMENSFDNILSENYLFDDVIKHKKKIKLNINKNNNYNDNNIENNNVNKKTINNFTDLIKNKKKIIFNKFKYKNLTNINNNNINTFSNNNNNKNSIIISESTSNIRKKFYNKLLNFNKNFQFSNKNYKTIKYNFSDSNYSNNKNKEEKNNKSEINNSNNFSFIKSFYLFNKRKKLSKNEEKKYNSLFTKIKTNNNEYNYQLSKKNLKTIYLKCEKNIKDSQNFVNYMENKNLLENKLLSKILNKSSKPKYSIDVKVIQNKLKKNKSSINIFTNNNNNNHNHKINVDLVYKMADNFAFEHRKELMKKLNYNYSNDKDFIFQKDSIKINEKIFKEFINKKNLNFSNKFPFKDLNVEKMMESDCKTKKNLMMRIDEDLQKYLSNGYYFKDKINNNINKTNKNNNTISLPKLSSYNLNE